jgi:hypothetical protein
MGGYDKRLKFRFKVLSGRTYLPKFEYYSSGIGDKLSAKMASTAFAKRIAFLWG